VQKKIAISLVWRRFAGGATWVLFGSILTSGTLLVTSAFVARALGKTDYGKYIVLQGTLSVFGIAAGFGIGIAATKYVAELRNNERDKLGRILCSMWRATLVFAMLATVILLFASNFIAEKVLVSKELATPFMLASLTVAFTALDGFHKAILLGCEAMQKYAYSSILGAVLCMPVIILTAYSYGLMGVSAAITIGSFLQASVSYFVVRNELANLGIKLNTPGNASERRVLFTFALPALIASALVSVAHWAAQAILANGHGGYAQVAVLGIAMQWLNYLMYIPSAASKVVTPMLTGFVSAGDHGSSKRVLAVSIIANGLLIFPASALVAVLSPQIALLYGNEFVGSNFPIVLAAATAALLSVQSPIGNLLFATSRMWMAAGMNLAWATAYLAFGLTFAGDGATGIMCALLIAYMFHAIWTLGFARLYLKQTPAI
jgi:O-antigen/teichoic acid export membrane protein